YGLSYSPPGSFLESTGGSILARAEEKPAEAKCTNLKRNTKLWLLAGEGSSLPISGHNAWLLAIFRVPDLRGRACARDPLAKSSRVVNEGEAAGLRYLAPVVYDGAFARTAGSARVQVAVSSHPDER